jgi:hypothetical protein
VIKLKLLVECLLGPPLLGIPNEFPDVLDLFALQTINIEVEGLRLLHLGAIFGGVEATVQIFFDFFRWLGMIFLYVVKVARHHQGLGSNVCSLSKVW